MDRILVYPGSIPLDTDLLNTNRNSMIALGSLAQTILGTGTVVDGLVCSPSTPASLSVTVGAGSIIQLSVVDTLAYGSLPADTTDALLKHGINLATTAFTLTPPTTSGQTINYLIQAALLESDTNPIVLPYYNAANPVQPYSGPNNSGVAQNTMRIQRVQLQLKAGAAANSGSQATPPVDNGWVGLYVITVSYGQAAITSGNITQHSSAPFLGWKLPALRPGFASGVSTYVASGTFTVPMGVTQAEVEVWGGGSGSFASTANFASRLRRRFRPEAGDRTDCRPSNTHHSGNWRLSGQYGRGRSHGGWHFKFRNICQRHRRQPEHPGQHTGSS
jgi:hypothetical protein